MGLIRFILIVGGLYLIFKILGAWLRSYLPRLIQKMYQNTYQQNTSAHHSNRSQGEVTIDTSRQSSKKHVEKDQGEYVDFEEVTD